MNKYLAEFIGCFSLIFFGCGAIVIHSELSVLGIALIFGAVIMIMVLTLGHISGAHFNPAVTIAFAATKQFPWKEVPAYVFMQVLGCLIGAILVAIFNQDFSYIGQTSPKESTLATSLFFIEFILAFTLMFVISGVATDSRSVGELAAVAIGGTVTMASAVFGPITGASMNPARTLGPAIAAQDYDSLIYYIFAPILGAIAGAFAYNLIKCDKKKSDKHIND